MATTDGLFTPTGFTSPEEIRRRIGKTVGDEATAFGIQQANIFQNPKDRLLAEIGGAFGRGLAGGIQSANSPEVQKAKNIQSIFGSITDLNDKEQVSNAARQAIDIGELAVAQQLADRALALQPKEEKGTANMQEYKFAVKQGYRGTFKQYEEEMKAAGAMKQFGTIPPGMRLVQQGDTYSLEAIPGGPVDIKNKENATQKAALAEQAQTASDIVTTDIDRAFDILDTTKIPVTSFGSLLKSVPGTPARDMLGLIDTVKANVGFDKLQQMRAASPTGGALGQVSERENELLQSVIGNLELSQSEDQLRFNLQRVKDVYNMVVHGTANPSGTKTISFEEALKNAK